MTNSEKMTNFLLIIMIESDCKKAADEVLMLKYNKPSPENSIKGAETLAKCIAVHMACAETAIKICKELLKPEKDEYPTISYRKTSAN